MRAVFGLLMWCLYLVLAILTLAGVIPGSSDPGHSGRAISLPPGITRTQVGECNGHQNSE